MKQKQDSHLKSWTSLTKKMMKANKDVGKLTKGIPELVAYTGELFLAELIAKVTENGQKELTPATILETIEKNKEYDFLIPIVPFIQEQVQALSHPKGKRAETAE